MMESAVPKTDLAELMERLWPATDSQASSQTATQIQRLRDLAADVKAQRQNHLDLSDREESFGNVVLFTGPSGTGKTTAAQLLARELGSDIFRMDTRQVISKYIGETEKNLAVLFGAGAKTGAILFFDEADALFGKRTEVKDSHDRYANLANELLRQAKAYRGLVIVGCSKPCGDLERAGRTFLCHDLRKA